MLMRMTIMVCCIACVGGNVLNANFIREWGETTGSYSIDQQQETVLRHSLATEVRREFGLEACQVVLGHARADVTQIYAEKHQALAAEVALKIG